MPFNFLDYGPTTIRLFVENDGRFKLLKHNSAVNKRQRFYTFAGFLVGVLGFGYGVYISVYPFTPDTAGAVQSKAQVELSKRG